MESIAGVSTRHDASLTIETEPLSGVVMAPPLRPEQKRRATRLLLARLAGRVALGGSAEVCCQQTDVVGLGRVSQRLRNTIRKTLEGQMKAVRDCL